MVDLNLATGFLKIRQLPTRWQLWCHTARRPGNGSHNGLTCTTAFVHCCQRHLKAFDSLHYTIPVLEQPYTC